MGPEVKWMALLIKVASVVSPRLAGRIAFAIWSRPAGRAKVRPGELPVHQEAVVERIPVNGKDVVIYRWGDGTNPVLLVHGWASRGSRYAPYVPLLRELGFTALSFDSPGHGDSGGTTNDIIEDRDIIRTLQDKYGHFRAIVGHSKGVLSMFFALRSGVTADRVVSISGPGEYGCLSDRLALLLSLSGRAHADLRRRIAASFLPETGIWEKFSVVTAPLATDAPILVIHDEDDDLIDFGQAALITAAYAPNARFHGTRKLGHRRIVANAEVARMAVDFVAAQSPVEQQTA